MGVGRFLRKNGTTIGLVAALCAAGAYVVATRNRPTTAEREQRKINLIKVYRADALTEIDVERDGTSFALRRKTTDADAGDEHLWHVVAGGSDQLADQFAVDRALTALEFAFPARTIKPEEVNRAQFGLEKPRLRLTLKMGTLSTTLALGGPAPRPEGSVYADVDGTVSVVKKETLAPVDLPESAFRTRMLVPYLSSELASFAIEEKDRKQVLERGAGTTWKLVQGGDGRVDRFAFDKLLTSFADLKADTFVTEEAAKKAQDGADTITLAMTPSDRTKPPGKLVVGGACPGKPDDVVVIRSAPSPLFACSGKGAFEQLKIGAKPDARVFSFREDEIEEVVLESGDKKLDLARKDKAWHERAPHDAEVGPEQVKTLLKAITTTAAEQPGTRDDKVAALDPPRAKVTVRSVAENETTRPPEVVDIGREEAGGLVPVRREQDGIVLRLRKDDVRALLPRETALRSTKVVDVGLDHVRRLALTWNDGGERKETIERSADGVWSLAEPKGYPLDSGVATSVTETAARLTADQWVADQDDGSFGLAKPRLRFELTTDEGDAGTKTWKVLLGDAGPLGIYGELEGEQGVFVVPRTTFESLASWAIDLSALEIDPTDTSNVAITASKRTIDLVADREGWKAGPGTPELSAAKLDQLKAALHDLHADAVVHLGAPTKNEGFDSPAAELRATRAPSGKIVRITIGAGDAYRGTSIFYARRDDVDCVYAIAAARARALLAAM